MFSEINQKLFELKDKIRIKNKNEAALADIIKLLESEEHKFEYFKEELEKEHRDVEKLEGLSITGIFHSILGNKDEQYEKEKKEFLTAKLKFDNCCSTLNVLRKEKDNLEKELGKQKGLEEEYELLIKEKEKLIINSNDPKAAELHLLSESISGYKLNLTEVDEAVTAGRDLDGVLSRIIDSLESAKGWGTWDMFGGGVIATAIKHDKIEQARSNIAVAQLKLSRFSKELDDTGIRNSMSIDIGGFETFADYFFDNLITDWLVQSKINNSLEQTNQVFYKVQSIIAGLLDKKCNLEKNISEAENLRKAALEKL